jgi:transposase
VAKYQRKGKDFAGPCPVHNGKNANSFRYEVEGRQTMRSRIEPMKKIARSLRQHREIILNYFRAQKLLSSGVVEGLNNKAKVTIRKSYGFRTFRCLELALYHSLGKLPEPESTHEFF